MFAEMFKLGWADVTQTHYFRNVRENLIKKSKNLLKSQDYGEENLIESARKCSQECTNIGIMFAKNLFAKRINIV
jgi:hypothetical protein